MRNEITIIFIILIRELLLRFYSYFSFCIDFQHVGTVAVPGRPSAPQQAPLQRWQSLYGIFIVYLMSGCLFLDSHP